MRVNILGTNYTIYKNVKEKDEPRIKDNYGFIDYCTKKIFIAEEAVMEDDTTMKNLKEFENKILRHEILHGFLYESGLRENSGNVIAWAQNEEMVDWFAIQSPKIFEAYKKINIL